MKITQIASTLNTVNQAMVGEIDVIADDLSNIVDVGKKILDFTSAANGDNYDNYMKNLIDQIGRVMFVDRVYTSQAPNILKDSWEYGSIMMKVRATMDAYKADTDKNYGDGIPMAQDNTTWDLAGIANGTGLSTGSTTPSKLDPFVLTKPSVQAKFYNKKITYEVPISLAREQLKEAFRSASEMARFFSMIENRIAMKRTLCTDALIMATIRNLIGNKLAKGTAINLLPLYNATVAQNAQISNAADFFTNPDAIRFANKTIALYKKYLSEASTLYNEGNYVTFTPADRLKAVFLSEYVKAAEVYLYSDTFHNEFDKLSGYEEVGYWQGTGNGVLDGVAQRGLVSGTYIDMEGDTVVGGASNVIAVLFDEQAAAVCCENDRVTSIYNPRGEYTNYFYKWDANYMNDLEENVLVFYVGTTSSAGVLPKTAPSNWDTAYAKASSPYYIWDTTTNAYRQLTADDKTTATGYDWDDYAGHAYYSTT